jgi:HSP20 family protein
VDIAGVRREDLHVAVDGQVLRISGVRRSPEGPEAVRLHQMEIAAGPFERRVRIPIAFDRAGVTAHLAEGFLTVTLPRRVRGQRPVEVRR